jgi:predicted signal transduction protein with EAL and GGDEF domain
LPDTDIASAIEVAERVRAAIAEVTVPGTDVPVTVSVGVAGFPDHASTLERIERLADAALYVAKREGRNRVEVASTDAGPDLPGRVLPTQTVNGSDDTGLNPAETQITQARG